MKDFIIQSIRGIRSAAGRSIAIVCSSIALHGLPPAAHANVIYWVGYQFGPPGGSLQNISNGASFFHGDQWLNYRVPGQNDVAVFDATVDPQANGMPRDVYFGAFTVPVVPIYNPTSISIPGGDALIDRLTIRNGDFRFLFNDELGAPQGSLSTNAQMALANVDDAAASLTILNGRLTTGFVTHIAPGTRSRGVLEVDGPGAEWIHNSYIDLGWVGNGRVTVKNGARMESLFNIIAGIRNGSTGTLEVLGGGEVLAHETVLIGNGHEATGLARGNLRVDGAGSRLTARSLGVGGNGGAGTVNISRGGRVEVGGGISLFSVASQASEIQVNGANSLLTSGGGLTIEGDGEGAIVRVDAEGTGRFASVSLNPYDSRPLGTASLIAKSGGLIAIGSTLSLRDRKGPSIVDAAGTGRIEIGNVATPAALGEIRIGDGGRLIGSGTLRGDLLVEAGGSVAPGFSPGHLDIEGDLALLDQSLLTLEIGGTQAGLFDRIDVTGDVALDGTALIRFIDGFAPSGGMSFDLLTSGGFVSGAFDEVRFENIAPNSVTAGFENGAFTVRTVPEPNIVTILLIGIALLAARRRTH